MINGLDLRYSNTMAVFNFGTRNAQSIILFVLPPRACIATVEYRIASAEQFKFVVTPALVSIGSLDN